MNSLGKLLSNQRSMARENSFFGLNVAHWTIVAALVVAPPALYVLIASREYEGVAMLGYQFRPIVNRDWPSSDSPMDEISSKRNLHPIIFKYGLTNHLHRRVRLERPLSGASVYQYLYDLWQSPSKSRESLDQYETYREMRRRLVILWEATAGGGNLRVRWKDSDPNLAGGIPNDIVTSYVEHVAQKAKRGAELRTQAGMKTSQPRAWIIRLAEARRISPNDTITTVLVAVGLIAGIVGVSLLRRRVDLPSRLRESAA
jgi:hypothetical protein